MDSRGFFSRNGGLLLSQSSDVGDEPLDLVVCELAFIGRHLVLPAGDNVRELSIGLALYVGRGQISYLQGLSRCCASASIRSMAHGALGFEIARAIGTRRGAKYEHDRKRQEYLLADSNHERVHFALPPFFVSCFFFLRARPVAVSRACFLA